MSKHLRAYFFQMEKVENFFLLVADVFTQEVKTLLKEIGFTSRTICGMKRCHESCRVYG